MVEGFTVSIMEIDIETKTVTLRCKSSTDANKLAGSIFSVRQVNPESRIIIRVIGAGALNQATKASILANKYFIKQGVTLALQPSFQTVEDFTAIELKIIFIKN